MKFKVTVRNRSYIVTAKDAKSVMDAISYIEDVEYKYLSPQAKEALRLAGINRTHSRGSADTIKYNGKKKHAKNIEDIPEELLSVRSVKLAHEVTESINEVAENMLQSDTDLSRIFNRVDLAIDRINSHLQSAQHPRTRKYLKSILKRALLERNQMSALIENIKHYKAPEYKLKSTEELTSNKNHTPNQKPNSHNSINPKLGSRTIGALRKRGCSDDEISNMSPEEAKKKLKK